jgi:hypothetical protein
MKKIITTIIAAVAAIGLMAHDADAKKAKRAPAADWPHVVIGPFDLGDSRLVMAGLIAGGAMLGTYFAIETHQALKTRGNKPGHNFNTGAFALTTVGCMTLSPMLASAIVWQTEGRYLSSREALGLGADCIVPIIGSAMWDAAYDANPHWK